MKIWLDDVRSLDYLRAQGTDAKLWTWIKTAEEVIPLLRSGQVEEIDFDHDLGLGMSGYDLAKMIEQMAINGEINQLAWWVHSQNPVGAKSICEAMKRADEAWSKKE